MTGTALVALVPAVAAAMLPRAYFGRRRVARLREVQAAWPDGLRDLVASIAAGRSLAHALVTLAEHRARSRSATRSPGSRRWPGCSGPVAALEVVKAELADPTSDRVIEVLILAHERGGPIVARILDDLVVATTKDLKVLDEIETEGLEMKINARAVLVMPWLVLRGVDDPRRGLPRLLLVAGRARRRARRRGAVRVGAWWIGRLGGAQEQRVFGSAQPLEVSA